MGTTVEAWATSEASWVDTRTLFADVEAELSRFRPDSALSALNENPNRHVSVTGRLAAALVAAADVRDRTDGLVDAGVGAAVTAWGYDRTFTQISDLDSPPSGLTAPVWDIADGVVTRPPGVALDLGGIGKGWTADLAVEAGYAVVASAGGDIRSADPRAVVPVTGPDGDVVATLAVGVGALATSSTARRQWRVAGERVSHLIDPRTSRPVRSPVVSATVIAETGVDAEAGAKAVLMLGVDGLAWASRQAWIRAAMVVWDTGSVYGTTGLRLAA